MLRNLNVATAGRRILGTPYVGLLAAQIAAETAVGDLGPGLLYNEAIKPENAGKRLRLRVTPWPSVGNLFVEENGAFTWTDLPDGVHSASYEYYEDGVLQGTTSFSIAVGVVDASAAGATLTGSSSLSAGAATGAAAGSAPGASLSGSSSISAGSATGQQSAAAPGSTLTGSSSIAVGAAAGTGAGVAGGATLTGASALTPGAATGQQSASAPGTSLTGTGSLQAGAATGSAVATVARPVSDAANSGWAASSGSDLYAMLDEITPNDADYIVASSVGSTCRLGLGAVADPGTSSGQQISYRANSPSGHGITVRLMQGGVQIASWSHPALPADPTTFVQTLTAGQCDAITDYSALSVEMIAI